MRNRNRFVIAVFLVTSSAKASTKEWIEIPAGSFEPLFVTSELSAKGKPAGEKADKANAGVGQKLVRVEAFQMQKDPISNEDYLAFVRENTDWKKSQIKRIFADPTYLSQWKDPQNFGKDLSPRAPVVEVSWFAAKAYCEWIGARLPTTDEWEYVSSLDNPAKRDAAILEWYSESNAASPASAEPSFVGTLGFRSMHGKIWEWTLDFNSSFITGESREDSSLSREMFCGAGSIGATKPNEYATFMRYALRSSLRSNYTLSHLGFRCAKDWKP